MSGKPSREAKVAVARHAAATGRAAFAGLAALVAVAIPRAASACAVCFSGPDETRGAFLATTVGMSVLPLALIGGIVWWLRRQVKAAERESQISPGLRAR